ncbi:hypothetical protein DFH08DRAFT_383466 [Mycena albidolilacea]|uniref:Uncharacterized protein n=1 Tax=Mycena albidolilacea TaxID=1033008 RepID=A0AAD6ZG77_9AGAR|nr:hypothetical protein DFH08DRAFT_383466 [Mycena albidolilacea]
MEQLPGRRLSTRGVSRNRIIPSPRRPPARRGAASSLFHLFPHPPFSCIPFIPRYVYPHPHPHPHPYIHPPHLRLQPHAPRHLSPPLVTVRVRHHAGAVRHRRTKIHDSRRRGSTPHREMKGGTWVRRAGRKRAAWARADARRQACRRAGGRERRTQAQECSGASKTQAQCVHRRGEEWNAEKPRRRAIRAPQGRHYCAQRERVAEVGGGGQGASHKEYGSVVEMGPAAKTKTQANAWR